MNVVNMNQPSKTVFVTVGTTQFDELINHVLDLNTLQVMEDYGFTHLILQIGSGKEPTIPNMKKIHVSWYRLKESISPDIESASLVISHAGAGTCLEVLELQKPLLVVVNQKLMGNHQMELAEKLQEEGCVLMTYPESLRDALIELTTTHLKPLSRSKLLPFSSYIETLMGFQ